MRIFPQSWKGFGSTSFTSVFSAFLGISHNCSSIRCSLALLFLALFSVFLQVPPVRKPDDVIDVWYAPRRRSDQSIDARQGAEKVAHFNVLMENGKIHFFNENHLKRKLRVPAYAMFYVKHSTTRHSTSNQLFRR